MYTIKVIGKNITRDEKNALENRRRVMLCFEAANLACESLPNEVMSLISSVDVNVYNADRGEVRIICHMSGDQPVFNYVEGEDKVIHTHWHQDITTSVLFTFTPDITLEEVVTRIGKAIATLLESIIDVSDIKTSQMRGVLSKLKGP